MAGRAHATADPDAPRQVELGRSRPARPRPAAEQARAARRGADRRLAEGARAIGRSRRWSRARGATQETWAGVVAAAGAAPTSLPARALPRRRRRRCSRCCARAPDVATAADARPPAGDRRLAPPAARRAAGRRGLRQVSRPPRPRSSTSTSTPGRTSAGAAGRLADFVVPRAPAREPFGPRRSSGADGRRIHFADLSVDKSARACLPSGRRDSAPSPGSARGLPADGPGGTPLGLRARALRPTNRGEAVPRVRRFGASPVSGRRDTAGDRVIPARR